MPLQIRRGTDAERQSMTVPLAPGEMLYTTDTQKIYVGNGTTLGGILTSGFNEDDAKDAAAEMIGDGSHTRISFSYDSENKTLSAIAEFNDDSAKDAAAEMITGGDHTGISFLYDTENKTLSAVIDTVDVSGPVFADAFVGSVFADDSTLLVDGINGRIVGPVFANVTGDVVGNLNGNVTGDVLGNVTGDVLGNVTGDVSANSIVTADLTVSQLLSDISSDNRLIFTQQDSVGNSIQIQKFSDENFPGTAISFLKSRGNANSKTAVGAGDRIGSINFNAFDGTNDLLAGTIFCNVDGTVSTGVVPTAIGFSVTNSIVTTLEAARFDTDGIFRMSRSAGGVFSIYQNFGNTNAAASVVFTKSRGTIVSPASVIENDHLTNLQFTGTTATGPTLSSFIRAAVDAPVSAGIVPGRIEFFTSDTAGNVSRRMVIKNNGVLLVDAIGALTSSLIIRGDLTGSVFADDSSMVIDGTEGGKITSPSVTLTDFLKLPTYADDTARSATISTPELGMVIFMISGTAPAASNQPQYFNGTNWINI